MNKIGSGQYTSVQILRGVAALLVVLHHAGTLAVERGLGPIGDIGWGAAGVDIFFSISGFVMVVATHRIWGCADEWRSFIQKRLVRVVPLYWLATSLKIALTIALPSLALHSHIELWHTVASLLFIPAIDPDTGGVFPVLTQGWTLSFEMLFYCIFAFGIFSHRRPVKIASGVLLLLSLFALQKKESWMPLGLVIDPILIEFVFGMLIGLATLHGKLASTRVAAALLVVSVAVFAGFGRYEESFDHLLRFVVWGIPAAAIVFACLSLERIFVGAAARYAGALGDASYAIYLFHTFTLPAVGIVWKHFHWTGTLAALSAVGACMVSSAVAGLIVHRYVEIPLTRSLRIVRGVPRRAV